MNPGPGLLLCLAALSAPAGPRAQQPSASAPASQGTAAAGRQASIPPERIVLTWSGDPATTQAVTWRTAAPVAAPVAELLPAPADPGAVKDPRAVPAATLALPLAPAGTAWHHTAEFLGLEPATSYAYRVGDGRTWSEWNHFTTAGRGPDSLAFLWLTDSQDGSRRLWPRAIRSAWRAAPEASFLLLTGDLVNVGDDDAQWGEFFAAGGWLHRTLPLLAVPGNHETYRLDRSLPRELTRHWRAQFAFPGNGPPGLEETCWHLSFPDILLVGLNSNERIEEQAAWLDRVLAGHLARWKVVAFHHPAFSTAKDRDNPEIRKHWLPVLEGRGADLVLQGHDHTYGRRSARGRGWARPDPGDGPVFVVSVGGPKMYDLHPGNAGAMDRTGEDRQLYQVITVDGDRLVYRCHLVTGELFDSFVLRKEPARARLLVEAEPSVLHRHRAAASP